MNNIERFVLNHLVQTVILKSNQTKQSQQKRNPFITIDDIVIPNVFKTVEARNNKLYVTVVVPPIMSTYNRIIELDTGYYNGFSFADELNKKLKAFTDYIHERRQDLFFDITADYDLLTNTISFKFIDKRPQDQNRNDPIIITIH